MDNITSPPLVAADHHASPKRKRSLSVDPSALPTPPAKIPKTASNHLHINYLARQYQEILPLITTDDPLPSLLSLISDYDGVLQRHESMAGNLGARPLGPILIQRFERLFDGPPCVLKTHGKDGTTIGWLDVVEFARNKPEQFNLEKMREGLRVCQFYTKQCRVEISEEDYVLIASGMPQKLIPPQPIGEDEEKELGTLEILEKNLHGVVQLADQVSARARQLNHRLKNRKSAIVSRREAEAAAKDDALQSPSIRGADIGSPRYQINGERRPSLSPTSGFTAVNTRPQMSNGQSGSYTGSPQEHPRSTASVNGNAHHGVSAATRAELLSKFHTSSERTTLANEQDASRNTSSLLPRRSSIPTKFRSKQSSGEQGDYPGMLLTSGSPVAIPSTPSSLLPFVKPSAADRFDDSGPFKADMMLRMEQLNRGDRVQPPCDRCRRLHMDCLKNLTACMGCTKKHAKCSWKDVEEQELKDHPFIPRVVLEGAGTGSDGEDVAMEGEKTKKDYSREAQGVVRDEELLGESSEDESVAPRKDELRERYFSAQSLSPPAVGITTNAVEAVAPPHAASVAGSPQLDQNERSSDAAHAPSGLPSTTEPQSSAPISTAPNGSTDPHTPHPISPTLTSADTSLAASSFSKSSHAPEAAAQDHPTIHRVNGHPADDKPDPFPQLTKAAIEIENIERNAPVRIYTAGREAASGADDASKDNSEVIPA